MQKIMNRLIRMIFPLCLLMGHYGHTQIVNGTFEQNASTVNCAAPYGWTIYAPIPSWASVLWDQRTVTPPFGQNYTTWFADLGGCQNSHGNGNYIEQTVSTIPNRTYKISFDLGFLIGEVKQIDAGVKLFINGAQQAGPQNGRFAHYDLTGTDSWSFKKFEYCFLATTATTTIRFVGAAAPTPFSPTGTTVADVRHIGLDNVTLANVTRVVTITGKCGEEMNINGLACGPNTSWTSPDDPNQGYILSDPYVIDRPVSMIGRSTTGSGSCCSILLHINVSEPDFRFEPLTYQRTGCNTYCIKLTEIEGPFTYSDDYGYNITWYVDGAVKGGAVTNFCHTFIEDRAHEVMAVIEKYDRCGNIFPDTVKTVINVPPMSTLADAPNRLIRICDTEDSASFEPCGTPFNRYAMFGSNFIKSGTLPVATPVKLAPGMYQLTCYDDAACAKQKTTVYVSKESCNNLRLQSKVLHIGRQTGGLRLDPNPVSSVFRIASGQVYETYRKVEIMDMNGRTVMTQAAINSETRIDMTPYPKGSYIVKVTTRDGNTIALRLMLLNN